MYNKEASKQSIMTSTWHFFHILSHKRHKTDHQMSHAAMTVLLCRFHKTKEVRETVRIQLLMPPPPKQQLRKKETFQYWNSAWQPPSEIWLQCSTVTSISSLLGIVIYLSKRGQGRGRRRERELSHPSPLSETSHLINETIDSVINACAPSY